MTALNSIATQVNKESTLYCMVQETDYKIMSNTLRRVKP